MRAIDHLVYAVHDLQEGIAYFENILGVQATIGGKHLEKGTHNALISLGDNSYLEIIARDPDSNIEDPLWMGLTVLSEPKLTRWAIHSENLLRDAKILTEKTNKNFIISKGSRETTSGKTLTWDMILPFALPEVDPIPFVLDWSNSELHPSDVLQNKCGLKEVIINYPDHLTLSSIFSAIEVETTIKASDQISINAVLECPKGIIII